MIRELKEDFLKRAEPQILELFSEEDRSLLSSLLENLSSQIIASPSDARTIEQAKANFGEEEWPSYEQNYVETILPQRQLKDRVDKLAQRFYPKLIEETKEVTARHTKKYYNAILRDLRENPEKLEKFKQEYPHVDVDSLEYINVE